jgi:adenylate cyclase
MAQKTTEKPQKTKKPRFSIAWFKAIGFWISIGLSLVLLTIYIFSREIGSIGWTAILDVIEAKTLDIRFHLRGVQEPQNKILIVAVDERTDDTLGRWQSSGRLWIAKLLDVLHDAGARVVGFDLALAEPDTGTAVEAIEAIEARYRERTPADVPGRAAMLAYFDEVKAEHDYDQRLAEAIRNTENVILGMYHFFQPDRASHLTPEMQVEYQARISRAKYTMVKFPPGVTRQPIGVPHSFGVEPNLEILSDAATSFGHFNALPFRDGYIRYSPLLVEYMADYYPSLALEVIRVYLDPPLPPIIHALGEEGGGSLGSVNNIQIGDIFIPTDQRGRLLLNFYGPGRTFEHYSFADVVLGHVPPETFRDAIVLLGFTSEIYQDLHSTSFEQGSYPGVEVHATVIENVLEQDFLLRPSFIALFDALIILICGIVLGVALHKMRPLPGAVTTIGALLIVSAIAYAAFVSWKIWLNVTYPFVFIILDYLIITSYRYFTEEKKKKAIKNVFQHYVSPSVVDHMLDQVDTLQLGGERRILTALFSDIRGFTSISEKMSPDQLVNFLNEYLTAMTDIVLQYEGTVDKYMGDAIMAFYGAPLSQDDHAVRACRTAIDMITRLKELRAEWETRSLPPMDIGIGLNSGEMSVGNMGSEERFDYTIMGDNVNLASRLEGINKQYGTNIVISEFTYEFVSDKGVVVRELDSVRVKGKETPVMIYELIGYAPSNPATEACMTYFHNGLHAYKRRQWDIAIEAFQEALRARPDDKPSQLYIERCQAYKTAPPPDNWDGVFVMKTK